MTSVTNAADQLMLRELFVPVVDELDAADLEVTGSLPAGLDGSFVRNGPNPRFEPLGRYHMFDGDGMLHAVALRDGRAVYRNRWIRTAALDAEVRVGRALYGGLGEMHFPTPDEVGDAGAMKNPANTNLIRHAGHYLALWEGGLPTEVTAELETVGPYDFDGCLQGSFTAHPRIDPRTGELLAFAYQPFEPYLRAFQIDAGGQWVRAVDIDLPAPSVMHDFAITEHHLVFVQSPLVFDLVGAMEGGSPFRWEPEVGTRIGVLPRDGAGDDIRWFEIADGYVNHFWNAWEDGDTITFSGSRSSGEGYTDGKDGNADATPGLPTRFVVDLVRGRATTEQIDDLGGDFTRINPAYTGIRSRYHTMGAFHGRPDVIGHFDTVVQYDDVSGTRTDWYAGPGMVVGEAVFAPAPDGEAENDGWLLCTLHERATGATDLAVLDARDVAGGPVATVHLPRRVPFGFHSCWFAAEA
ncbi:MAG TPA: carotenoid oxygenase family protein [Acidimicrobiales bacterium]